MLDPFTLEGTYVRLEPLSEDHVPALVEAASEDRSNYQWAIVPDGTEQMVAYVRDAMAKVASGAHVAFATVRRGQEPGEPDRVVGSTRFCEVAYWQYAARRDPAARTACPTSSTSGSPSSPARSSARRSTPRPSC